MTISDQNRDEGEATLTRNGVLARLEQAGQLVESRVRPDGSYDGWSGRDVLCHLGAYAHFVAALLRGIAERRQPTPLELYGRELTDEEQRGGLDEQNELIRQEYASLGWDESLAFWRSAHGEVMTQVNRVSDADLAAPGPPDLPAWSRQHLYEVVTTLIHHYEGHMASASDATRQREAKIAATIRERLAATGRTFSDSVDLIRDDRDR